MPNENIVFNRDAFADERVARYLASAPNLGVFLNLDEGSDFRFFADLAAIQIDEFRELDVFAELYIRSKLQYSFTGEPTLPSFGSTRSAASSIRTMRKPAMPSLNGVFRSVRAVGKVIQFHSQALPIAPPAAPTCRLCGNSLEISKPFSRSDIHAFVVNANFSSATRSFHTSIFFLSAYQRRPHLHRREPVDVNVRNDAVRGNKS